MHESRFGDEDERLMHLVPAPAVILLKRRVLSRPGAKSLSPCRACLVFDWPLSTCWLNLADSKTRRSVSKMKQESFNHRILEPSIYCLLKSRWFKSQDPVFKTLSFHCKKGITMKWKEKSWSLSTHQKKREWKERCSGTKRRYYQSIGQCYRNSSLIVFSFLFLSRVPDD